MCNEHNLLCWWLNLTRIDHHVYLKKKTYKRNVYSIDFVFKLVLDDFILSCIHHLQIANYKKKTSNYASCMPTSTLSNRYISIQPLNLNLLTRTHSIHNYMLCTVIL